MPLFALFFTCALVAYALNMVLRHLAFWGWGPFVLPTAALLLPSLAAGSGGGQKLHGLSCEASAGRYVLAAWVVAGAYPRAFAAARALSLWCERLVPPAVPEAVPGLTTGLNQVAISLAALVIPM